MSLEGLQLDQYRLLRLVGSGGMGDVYLASDTRLEGLSNVKRQIAIKLIRAEEGPYQDVRAAKEATRLFQREMKAILVLDHPHILPLIDFGEISYNSSTLSYIVMPYQPEGSLTDWLKRREDPSPLSVEELAHFLSQAADALQHAHDHHLIHQDVKPSNFLIRERSGMTHLPDLLLADFGVAKFLTMTTPASASRSVRGTPAYMAPEQWDGRPVPATDQYALAVMAYQLLTGQNPFQGGPGQLMRQHFTVQPQPPSRLNPSVPLSIDVVILRALEKKPHDRYASITAFAQAYDEALQ